MWWDDCRVANRRRGGKSLQATCPRSVLLTGTIASQKQTAYSMKPHLVLLVLWLATVALFWSPLRATVNLSMDDYRYSAISAAPFLCIFLLYIDRNQIFSTSRFSPRLGVPLFSVAAMLALFLMHRISGSDEIDRLFPVVLAVVLSWLAAFLLCYGVSSFKASIYPLCCLLLAVPIPAKGIDSFSAALQNGSAVCSYALLQLCGVSVYRQGTMFAIPGLEFNIAPECSGIRSACAFLIVALLAGRLFLRSSWARILLVISTIPIAMFKNAVRITVTTSLGAFVDRSFIDGPFHHQYGGVIFAPVDALLFIPLLLALQKLENRSPKTAPVERPEYSTT